MFEVFRSFVRKIGHSKEKSSVCVIDTGTQRLLRLLGTVLPGALRQQIQSGIKAIVNLYGSATVKNLYCDSLAVLWYIRLRPITLMLGGGGVARVCSHAVAGGPTSQ